MDWRTRREWLIEKRRLRLTEIRKIGKTERRENWLEKKWQTGLESREERKKRRRRDVLGWGLNEQRMENEGEKNG